MTSDKGTSLIGMAWEARIAEFLHSLPDVIPSTTDPAITTSMLCCELSAQLREVMAVGLGWMAIDVAPKGTIIREPEQYPAKALASICLLMHAYILKASRSNRMIEASAESTGAQEGQTKILHRQRFEALL